MDMSEPVVMLLKTWADCVLEESLFESCKVALNKVALNSSLMMFSLAT